MIGDIAGMIAIAIGKPPSEAVDIANYMQKYDGNIAGNLGLAEFTDFMEILRFGVPEHIIVTRMEEDGTISQD